MIPKPGERRTAVDRRRGFSAAKSATQAGDKDKVRTHMMFSATQEHSQKKRTRRKANKYHKIHQHDATVQTGPPDQVDPHLWSGNQRVVHFGPMAQRDPFFYYYPKGWDIVYPAHFGFFPYRTKKFRGSSPTVCLAAFGVLFAAGGAFMIYLGFFVLYAPPWTLEKPFEALPPLQVAGPLFLLLGVVCFLAGGCWWFWSLRLFNERLRHTQPHHAPPRRTIHRRPPPETRRIGTMSARDPYRPPPPPPFPVLANAHTQGSLYSPQAEMKLYPPTLSGPSLSSLVTPSASLPAAMDDLAWPEYHASKMRYHYPA